ncbi:unnamed protein product [Arabidopsis halleri]
MAQTVAARSESPRPWRRDLNRKDRGGEIWKAELTI